MDETPTGARRALRWTGAVATVLCLAIAAILLVPAALGYQRYVIVSGSMTGTYDRGSIIFDKEVPVDDLKVGDPITYQPPQGASPEKLLTHRIVWIGDNKQGEEIFRTKGDANETADPWTFSLDKPEQAKVAFSVPYVGYLLAGLSIPIVRMLAIGIPAVLVAILILAGIWRDAGEEARRRETQGSVTPRWTE
ncbi:MAG TPA: signal peptidase I [Solirubrobacterales bacterium]|jgi:signal peptidase|nr:signal peptidase I [Solirubrobacterales bacterium]